MGDPDEPKFWKGARTTLTRQQDIFKEVKRINFKAYNQAYTTPFASGPLAEAFGKFGNTECARSILVGLELQPELAAGLLPETLAIIDILRADEAPIPNFQVEITPAQLISSYKRIKERAASSPSSRHVGHTKAVLDRPATVQAYACMMFIPFYVGFSPKRWQTVVDVMLPKDVGTSYGHCMWIIQIYKHDFNQATWEIFARRVGFHLEDNNLLPEMQYGSRKGQLCVAPVLNKRLMYDIAIYAKQVLMTLEFDAMGCYDRIVLLIGS